MKPHFFHHSFCISTLLGSLPYAGLAPVSPLLALEATKPQEMVPDLDFKLPGREAYTTEILKRYPNLPLATALLVSEKGSPLASLTWVGKEGYFLTKASEVYDAASARIQLQAKQLFSFREIRRLTEHDVLIGQIIDGPAPQSTIALAPASQPALQRGDWLFAPVPSAPAPRLGVCSASSREIQGFGPAIGIRMEPGSHPSGGVLISGIAEDSPAEKAGLRAGDVLLKLNNEATKDPQTTTNLIKEHQPGDFLNLEYQRMGQLRKARVRLASRTKVMMNWQGEDFANGGISIRTDAFKNIIQHDLPLSPIEMGSPLFDLKGQCVGINIARVDRVTTFALPLTLLQSEIQQILEADRHPPKAQRVPVESSR